MVKIEYATKSDKAFWFSLDFHISEDGFYSKVRDKQGYVLYADNIPVGLLRYNLFWDSIPFCTMLYIAEAYRACGYGSELMKHWEAEMKAAGHGMVMTSSQANETAQHFYRKLGYKDSGGLILDIHGYEQPTELFFTKAI